MSVPPQYFDIVLRYQLLGKISGPVRLLLWPPSTFLPLLWLAYYKVSCLR